MREQAHGSPNRTVGEVQQWIGFLGTPEISIHSVTKVILRFDQRGFRNSRMSSELGMSKVTKTLGEIRRRRRSRIANLFAESAIASCVRPVKKCVHFLLEFVRELPRFELIESSGDNHAVA